jgi:hypothetical protein
MEINAPATASREAPSDTDYLTSLPTPAAELVCAELAEERDYAALAFLAQKIRVFRAAARPLLSQKLDAHRKRTAELAQTAEEIRREHEKEGGGPLAHATEFFFIKEETRRQMGDVSATAKALWARYLAEPPQAAQAHCGVEYDDFWSSDCRKVGGRQMVPCDELVYSVWRWRSPGGRFYRLFDINNFPDDNAHGAVFVLAAAPTAGSSTTIATGYRYMSPPSSASRCSRSFLRGRTTSST